MGNSEGWWLVVNSRISAKTFVLLQLFVLIELFIRYKKVLLYSGTQSKRFILIK